MCAKALTASSPRSPLQKLLARPSTLYGTLNAQRKRQWRYENERDRPNISLPARCFSGRDAGAALAELCRRCANNDTDGSARTDETQWFRAESQSLVSWADTHGWLWSDPHLEEITQGLDCFEGGAEHNVFSTVEIRWVLKITKPPGFGLQSSLCKYLRNILWSNRLFVNDIRFEGVIQRGDGVSILTSQPFLKGRAPSLHEIELWFFAKGYGGAICVAAIISGVTPPLGRSSRPHHSCAIGK
jgi:hypothetical protein